MDLDDWVAVASDLQQRYPELFGKLLKKIGEDENPELAINLLNRAYEAKERKPVSSCERFRSCVYPVLGRL